MTAAAKRLQHRLDGLEPGNLLAFLALLGLLRALEEATPAWLPRVAWSVAELPLRPVLSLSEAVGRDAIVAAAATGIQRLAARHAFGTFKDLKLPLEIATKKLHQAAGSDSYTADLWAALASDAAVRERNKVLEVEPTPLCLMFGQGYQHFLERLQAVPRQRQPDRGPKRNQPTISETDCLSEALFSPWTRPDATPSFRWDSHEDVRYAHRATDPTDPKTKATTQHGANRLAAVGLAALTVVPRRRAGKVRLDVLGGGRDPDGTFIFTWPIWREPISLAALRTLLGHPGLDQPATRAALGIAELRRARRSSFGRYMNFTPAVAVERRHSPKPSSMRPSPAPQVDARPGLRRSNSRARCMFILQ